jgi:iron complex transport system substrate-binding protein
VKVRIRMPVAVVIAAVATGWSVAACSGGSAAPGEVASTTTTSGAGVRSLGRVVTLGEEFLLADLLALGVRPVASTATVADAGFQGIQEHDTEGIQALPSDRADLERLAALRPDTIVTTRFIADQVGPDELDAIADVIVLPNGLDEDGQLQHLGRELGREREATRLEAEVKAARDEAKAATPPGCRVSVATVYPGPSLAAWVAAPNAAATALEEMGCSLAPDRRAGTVDVSGRIRLSLEEIGRFDAPTLILQQTSTVEGEDAALADVQRNPLWARLPAVTSDHVVTIDRLGYPGAEGKLRLYRDLADAVRA